MKIFLIGHYGGQNTGDDAMLLACVKQLSQMGARIKYITRTGEAVPFLSVYDSAFPLSRNVRDVLNCVVWADWLVLGGGTHFHDDYMPKRLLRHYRYMLSIAAVCAVAKKLGKRVAWIGMGLGPFQSSIGRKIFAIALRFVDHISVRDKRSLEELKNYSCMASVTKSFDLSAILLSNDRIGVQSDKHSSSVLGVSPTLLHGSEARVGVSSETFWKFVAESIAHYFKNENTLIRIFEFRGGHRESDRSLCLTFADSVKNGGIKRVEYIPYSANPLTTLSLISECSWFIASRYHSAMFAYLTGRPTLILPYHRKLVDLVDEVQWPPNVVVDLNGHEWRDDFSRKLYELKEYPERFMAGLPVKDAVIDAMKNFEMFK